MSNGQIEELVARLSERCAGDCIAGQAILTAVAEATEGYQDLIEHHELHHQQQRISELNAAALKRENDEAVAAEREACDRLAYSLGSHIIANAIRARGEEVLTC